MTPWRCRDYCADDGGWSSRVVLTAHQQAYRQMRKNTTEGSCRVTPFLPSHKDSRKHKGPRVIVLLNCGPSSYAQGHYYYELSPTTSALPPTKPTSHAVRHGRALLVSVHAPMASRAQRERLPWSQGERMVAGAKRPRMSMLCRAPQRHRVQMQSSCQSWTRVFSRLHTESLTGTLLPRRTRKCDRRSHLVRQHPSPTVHSIARATAPSAVTGSQACDQGRLREASSA